MAELPQIPDLDPDGDDDALGDIDVDIPVDLEETPEPEPAVQPAPAAQPPSQPPASMVSRRSTSVTESVEEMLSQTADLTLHLGRLEETVANSGAELEDLREEMQTGLMQVSTGQQGIIQMLQQITAQLQQTQAVKAGEPSLGLRIDELDGRVLRAARKQTRIFVAGIIQIVLLAAVAALVFLTQQGSLEVGGSSEPPPPPEAVESGFPQPEGEPMIQPKAKKPTPRKKRRRRR